ncbi:type II toxin-antitoxin system HicB family antitoxin [Halorhabdus amylolytica]|uniref:type II toxin-antitoxin system HicB family antitoxin n=1 Tax=Halorhabdus amylolytica TaxID=2559573 RepID=UPI0010AA01E9|nr:type II toxin-antitoxin system HicB family antitoxin [Halorhabdus amylolytica]
MSSDVDRRGGNHNTPVEITLRRGEDADVWIAEEVSTGVTSQGSTREAALENLDEALAGIDGEGTPPSQDDLEELGIDPASNVSTEPSELFSPLAY